MSKSVCGLCEHFLKGTICKLGYLQDGNEKCIGYKKMKPIHINDNMKARGHESTEYLKDNDVIKPSHYKAGEFDVIAFCQKHNLSFDVGNVIKYVTRAGKKKDNSELQDLNKAMEYLKRRIEFVKGDK